MEIVFSTDIATEAQILEHLRRCDTLFIPPLSQRTALDSYVRKLLSKASRLEAFFDGDLIGLVAGYFDGPSGYITTVSVDEPFQGQGVARELVSRCLRLASLTCHEVQLEAHLGSVAAHRLYCELGFVSIGPPIDGFIRLRKELVRAKF